MNRSLIISIAIFLTPISCGPGRTSHELLQALLDFETTYSVILPNFSEHYSTKLRNMNIELTDSLIRPIVGLCTYGIINSIQIDRDYWLTGTPIGINVDLYHELGHCLFDRHEHREDKYEDGCPKSIMSSVLMSDYCFSVHHDELILELPNK